MGKTAGEKLIRLVDLMAHLRGPDGCPWDRDQDYDSIKGMLLEEAYEVVDAVNLKDFKGLEEELGDLLFQVVFYSRLAEEDRKFDIDGVIRNVHDKLVRRHPHVFGKTRAANAEEALKSWTTAKEKEKNSHTDSRGASLLDGVASALPSTLESYELGLRAAAAGFDWVKIEDLLDKVEEELYEIRKELTGCTVPDQNRLKEEAGDLMFAVANLIRLVRSDPESCLRAANQKFRRRFQALEGEVKRRGKSVQDCTPQELDGIWELVKAQEKR
ncbi:MAG: nucleoside triphosphate pyrophosphohydrolase [Acidobacteria bacterium]|nr:MAG: nucleoside triphosphate pyrophosphohydrolase [Acidobacteriota bacterium]